MERQTKRRRKTLNSSLQQQIIASSIQTRSKTRSLVIDFYFPDECWEFVFKFLINDGNSDGNNRLYLRCLSFVSKQFLSITNRLRFSLNISNSTRPLLPRLFQRFTNLTSLNLTHFRGDLDALLAEISCFPLNLTSLDLSQKPTIPANGLRAFSQNITTLTSLTCSFTKSINYSDLFLMVDCFPNLQMLDLRYSYDVSEEAVVHVLRTCCNIRHLNLTRCSRVKLRTLNFKVLKLEVLNLSFTRVDDEALNVISKSCSGLLQLLLFYCSDVTDKGVNHVVENCTQLREIDLGGCDKVHANVVASMVHSRTSLRKIGAPPGFDLSDTEKLFLHHGCYVS